MAKRVSVPKSPFPYELRDELAELARYLAPEGPLKPGVPTPGDSPIWDLVYAQLTLSLRMLQVAQMVDKLDSVEREAMKAFAKALKEQGDVIAKSMLEIFHSAEPVSITIQKTRSGFYFADTLPNTRTGSLAETLTKAAAGRKKKR